MNSPLCQFVSFLVSIYFIFVVMKPERRFVSGIESPRNAVLDAKILYVRFVASVARLARWQGRPQTMRRWRGGSFRQMVFRLILLLRSKCKCSDEEDFSMFGLVWSRSCVFICNFQERRSADIYYVRLDLEADSYNKPSKLKMAEKFITYLWSNRIALSIIKNSTHQ